jgi:hypothetical protein
MVGSNRNNIIIYNVHRFAIFDKAVGIDFAVMPVTLGEIAGPENGFL